MNNSIKSLLQILIFCLVRILPKFKWVALSGFPTHEDSIVAIAKHLLEGHKPFRVFIFEHDQIPDNKRIHGAIYVSRKSVAGIVIFSLSKHILFTHFLYLSKYPKNQISTNIWHGMPIKSIGLLRPSGKGRKTTFAFSTSPFFQRIISSAFGIPLDATLTSGIPRNDILRAPGHTRRHEILSELGFKSDGQFIVWLPTYRLTVTGDPEADGDINISSNVFNLPDVTYDAFNDILRKLEIMCFVKSHPLGRDYEEYRGSNLHVANAKTTNGYNYTLYEILSCADLLITDVSSVMIDFLLCDKPIFLCFPDIESYASTRGILLNPIADYLPGPTILTKEALESHLTRFSAGIDDYINVRSNLKNLFHEIQDFSSTRACVNAIFAGNPLVKRIS